MNKHFCIFSRECDKCEQIYATKIGLKKHIKLNKDQSCGIAYFLKRRQMEKNLRIRRKLVFRKQKWKFAKIPKLSADEGPLGPLSTVEKKMILRIFDSNMELHNNNYTKVCRLYLLNIYIKPNAQWLSSKLNQYISSFSVNMVSANFFINARSTTITSIILTLSYVFVSNVEAISSYSSLK